MLMNILKKIRKVGRVNALYVDVPCFGDRLNCEGYFRGMEAEVNFFEEKFEGGHRVNPPEVVYVNLSEGFDVILAGGIMVEFFEKIFPKKSGNLGSESHPEYYVELPEDAGDEEIGFLNENLNLKKICLKVDLDNVVAINSLSNLEPTILDLTIPTNIDPREILEKITPCHISTEITDQTSEETYLNFCQILESEYTYNNYHFFNFSSEKIHESKLGKIQLSPFHNYLGIGMRGKSRIDGYHYENNYRTPQSYQNFHQNPELLSKQKYRKELEDGYNAFRFWIFDSLLYKSGLEYSEFKAHFIEQGHADTAFKLLEDRVSTKLDDSYYQICRKDRCIRLEKRGWWRIGHIGPLLTETIDEYIQSMDN